jgi:hypothetical protein
MHIITSNTLFFEVYPRFATNKWGKISNFIVLLFSNSYMRGGAHLDYFVYHKDNEFLSIYKYLKNQNDFIIINLKIE